jgi:hypothetical protein
MTPNGNPPKDEMPPALQWLDRIWPVVVRYTGLAIAIYETVVEKLDRPSLLILAAGMMGLQNVVEWQRAVRTKQTQEKDS